MENKKIKSKSVFTTRLIKSEDLNHHGTLFAGRASEWFVESGFFAAATLLNPKNIVCLKIHGLHFTKPIRAGEIITFVSKIVYTGKSSLTSFIYVKNDNIDELLLSGFITFIFVDEQTNAVAHNIELIIESEEDKILFEQALNLKNNKS